MKKIFLFATIAAAGLFASCSSSDDAVSGASNNPIEDADGRQAIKIGISNIVNMATRGTGTVGGVENNTDGIQNVWAGQRINAFMFTQLHTLADPNANPAVPESWSPTLNLTEVDGIALYDNQVMITPGTADNLIDNMNLSVASGEAMIEDGTINYYPIEGRYDFFGYHGDDAVNRGDGITKTNDKWTVPFTIDGSQDLMSTRAVLTAEQATTMGQKAEANRNNYFSAYSARQNVQPTLTFNHLLTRLAFKVKAGNNNASGYQAAVVEVNVVTDNVNASATAQNLTDAQAAGKGYVKGTTGDLSLADWQKTLPVGTGYVYSDGEATPTITSFDITTAYVAPQAAGQNWAKAVKVTSIKINSKNKGDLAVAWIEDPTSYTYTMSMITATDYATLPNDVQTAHWGTAVHQDPNDNNSAIVGYEWTGGDVNYNTYLTVLKEIERKYATATTGTLTDANKITWGTSVDWLSLQERPYAKLKSGETVDLADFEGGADLAADLATKLAAKNTADGNLTDQIKDDYNTAKSNLEAAQAALLAAQQAAAADPSDATLAQAVTDAETDVATKQGTFDTAKALYDPLKAALDDATEKYDQVKAKSDALLALVAEATITEYAYNKLTNAGQGKYDDIHTANLNENLIALSPTAPSIDLNTTTNVGEALIVAPKETGDYEMKVTIQQDVPTSWTDPTKLQTKEIEYPLTIKAPAGGFKVNTSYNIILTVYGLERIEVIAVVTPWEDSHNPIVIGQD